MAKQGAEGFGLLQKAAELRALSLRGLNKDQRTSSPLAIQESFVVHVLRGFCNRYKPLEGGQNGNPI